MLTFKGHLIDTIGAFKLNMLIPAGDLIHSDQAFY
jgi:hypothetical protein